MIRDHSTHNTVQPHARVSFSVIPSIEIYTLDSTSMFAMRLHFGDWNATSVLCCSIKWMCKHTFARYTHKFMYVRYVVCDAIRVYIVCTLYTTPRTKGGHTHDTTIPYDALRCYEIYKIDGCASVRLVFVSNTQCGVYMCYNTIMMLYVICYTYFSLAQSPSLSCSFCTESRSTVSFHAIVSVGCLLCVRQQTTKRTKTESQIYRTIGARSTQHNFALLTLHSNSIYTSMELYEKQTTVMCVCVCVYAFECVKNSHCAQN